MNVIIIAAIANNNVIGFNGKIPWHSAKDLKLFKEKTTGSAVIMGRKTYESLGKNLEHREMIVISNSLKKIKDGFVFDSLSSALEFCNYKNYSKVFLIGGESIYKDGLKIADELIITRFDIDTPGDTFFPEIDEDLWDLKNKIDFNGFSVYNYLRKYN